MGFWFFMLLMNLLIPVMMIGFGRLFYKKAPKQINGLYGYRTSMSMKNQDTWQFAHHYFGKLWYRGGLLLLLLTVLFMLPLLYKDTNTVGKWGSILCGLQCVWVIVPIVPTERALRKKFDREGNVLLNTTCRKR